jgi:hypothetical protein
VVNHSGRRVGLRCWPPGLGQGADPVGPLGQVVQGTEEQHGVHPGVRLLEPPGVPDGRRGQWRRGLLPGGGQGLLDVQGHRVDEVDLVAAGGQRQGVHPGRAADVQDHGRRVREVPGQQLPGPGPLQVPGVGQPLPLGHGGIVAGDLRVEPALVVHCRRGQRRLGR